MKAAIKKAELGENINPSLYDTHRKIHKAKGGEYVEGNVEVHTPRAHMRIHGNLKEREESMEKLKGMMDARRQMLKTRNAINNRVLAFERRTDYVDEKTIEELREQSKLADKTLKRYERQVSKHLEAMPHEIIKKALEVDGLGFLTIAQLITYIDIEKARYASSLWAYVGHDKASHQRYTKNEAGGGNKTLRTALYAMAESFIKRRNAYRDVYDNEKMKLSASKLVTKSRNTQGKLIECMWKDTKPSHRHGAAIRKMVKHFLADFWFVWRTLEGLPTPNLYVEEKMGHTGIVRPEERGWNI